MIKSTIQCPIIYIPLSSTLIYCRNLSQENMRQNLLLWHIYQTSSGWWWSSSSGLIKMRSRLGTQFMAFFWLKARILTFRDKKYRILKFCDKRPLLYSKCPWFAHNAVAAGIDILFSTEKAKATALNKVNFEIHQSSYQKPNAPSQVTNTRSQMPKTQSICICQPKHQVRHLNQNNIPIKISSTPQYCLTLFGKKR